ncbi:MAG: uroporphyrinogen-III synthase [Alphaproteobacteria bacterium]|nr:uroporphyrinogen-III synthase [Alphaproteobacteria bacterium]
MILITRPLAQSLETGTLLQSRGFNYFCEPMLRIHFQASGEEEKISVAIFTSAHGVAGIGEDIVSQQPIVIAVGQATAEKAEARGLKNVAYTHGNSQEVYEWICQHIEKTQTIRHFCGQHHAGEIVSRLQGLGYKADERVVYKAEPVYEISDELECKLNQGVIRSALFFSSRTATVFVENIKQKGMVASMASVKAFCLSQPIADCLQREMWQKVIVADKPTQACLLEQIESEYR